MKVPGEDSAPPAWSAILLAGLLGGTGDFVFALVYYGWRLRVFQSVAAGLIGREAAFAGGIPTFLLGVGLHFLIAVIWAALFWAGSRAVPLLRRHALPAGLLYGLVIYLGMNCVVIPLSALHGRPWPPSLDPWPIISHLLVVGLPIALIVGRSR